MSDHAEKFAAFVVWANADDDPEASWTMARWQAKVLVAERDGLRARVEQRGLGPAPVEGVGGPGKEEVYWLRQKLDASVRHLRDIEDYYRMRGGLPEGFNQIRADRARSLYEQISEDFLNGKTTIPTMRERAEAAEARVEQLGAERDEANRHHALSVDTNRRLLVQRDEIRIERDQLRLRGEQLEAALRERIEPPYVQVIGRNAVVLLTPEQIDRIIREFGDYPVTNDLTAGISAEMHRAKNALARAALSGLGDAG